MRGGPCSGPGQHIPWRVLHSRCCTDAYLKTHLWRMFLLSNRSTASAVPLGCTKKAPLDAVHANDRDITTAGPPFVCRHRCRCCATAGAMEQPGSAAPIDWRRNVVLHVFACDSQSMAGYDRPRPTAGYAGAVRSQAGGDGGGTVQAQVVLAAQVRLLAVLAVPCSRSWSTCKERPAALSLHRRSTASKRCCLLCVLCMEHADWPTAAMLCRAWASPCIRILFHLSPVMRRRGVRTCVAALRPEGVAALLGHGPVSPATWC